MKLRNKLIPIISAATVAATIAPISSCAIGQTAVNLINGYTPSIKKAVWEDYKANKDDMLSFYASAVNENPEIFAQDMYWKYCVDSFYYRNTLDSESWSKTTENTMDALVSNVAVRKLTCFYDEEQERKEINYYTISFDFQFHWNYKVDDDCYWYYDDNWGKWNYYYVQTDFDKVVNISVKNIPITINREGTRVYHDIEGLTPIEDYNPLFRFSFDDGWVKFGNEWYFNRLNEHNDAFKGGNLPTSWIIQPIVNEKAKAAGDEWQLDSFEHDAFTRLENNGYEWYVKLNNTQTTTTTPYRTSKPETTTEVMNFEFKEDSQFDAAEKAYASGDTSLDFYVADQLFRFYLPSYYLSDIEDINEQLWSLAK